MEKDVPVVQLQKVRDESMMYLEEEDEELDSQSTLTFLFTQLKEFYVDNIPVEIVKQLPHCGKYFIGSLCYCLSLLIFVYFTYTNYQSSITQAFISLDSSSGNCKTVPISVTASYYADVNGNWEGTPDFLYYQSLYSFHFSSFEVSSLSDYLLMMQVYSDSLNYYNQLAETQNLALNAILWMSFIRFYSTQNPYTTDFSTTGRGNLQFLQLSGAPDVVFQARYSGLSLGSPKGFCQIPAMVLYDEANALFKATIRMDVFLNSTTCSAVTTPFIFQNQNGFSSYFAIDLDVRSFSTALAVNLGYIQIQNLLVASGSVLRLKIKSAIYAVGQYFDIRYPRMSPIFCLYNTTVLPKNYAQIINLCLISTGSGLFLPIMNHMGNSLSVPEYCDCKDPTIGRSSQCNKFYLMAGLIAFPANITSSFAGPDMVVTLLRYAFELVASHGADYRKLNRAAFNASAVSVFTAMGSASPTIQTSSYLEDAFNFCRLPSSGITCSLITFYSLDQDNTVSDYHYPLLQGSCVSSITVNDSAWQNLASTPPTPLTQIYYECLPAQYDAFLNAVGVASGNTSIAMLILLFLCVPIVFGIIACCRQIPIPQEYSEKQKEKTLDTLATLILRIRDDHYEGIAKDSEISKIAEEMVKAVTYSNRGILLHNLKQQNNNERVSFKVLKQEDSQISHRELLGKTYIYRHKQDHRQKNSEQLGYSLDSLDKVERSQLLLNSRSNDTIGGGEVRELVLEESVQIPFFRIHVLNSFTTDMSFALEEDPQWIQPYHNAEIKTIIEGLVFYFSAAIRNQIVREKGMKRQTDGLFTPTDGSTDSHQSNDQGHSNPVNTAPSDSLPPIHLDVPLYNIDADYAKGCILSQKLLSIHVHEFLDKSDSILFTTLANALCMHASLELKKDMKYISNEMSETIGYQIGDKIFTYSVIIAYSLKTASMESIM